MRKGQNSKTTFKKFTSTKFFLVLVFLSLIFLTPLSKTFAYNISPDIEEFTLEIYQEKESIIYFTNSGEETEDFKIYSHRYNPEKKEILDTRNFITLQQETLSVEPGETAEINYKIKIPGDTLNGSYFSIIVVESTETKEPTPLSSIGLNYGIGSLIAIHVIDDTDITEVFLNQTNITLRQKNTLNPLKTELEYKITNNSKYTFLPAGQLVITSQGEPPLFYTINENELKLYPNAELTFNFNYEGELKDFLTNKKATARIGTQFSNHLRETQIELPYFSQSSNYAMIAGLLLAILIIAVILTRRQGSKKAKDMLKKKMSPAQE